MYVSWDVLTAMGSREKRFGSEDYWERCLYT